MVLRWWCSFSFISFSWFFSPRGGNVWGKHESLWLSYPSPPLGQYYLDKFSPVSYPDSNLSQCTRWKSAEKAFGVGSKLCQDLKLPVLYTHTGPHLAFHNSFTFSLISFSCLYYRPILLPCCAFHLSLAGGVKWYPFMDVLHLIAQWAQQSDGLRQL